VLVRDKNASASGDRDLLLDAAGDFHPPLQWNLLPLVLWISRNVVGQEIIFSNCVSGSWR